MDEVTCDIAAKFLKGNNLQWRDWTLDDLSLLMAVYVVHCRLSSFNLVLLFEYFDPVSCNVCEVAMVIVQHCQSVIVLFPYLF